MSYIIKNTEVLNEILTTDVEFVFSDGSTEIIKVPHFMPENKEQVIANIEQRELSELAIRNAVIKNSLIAQELEKEIVSSRIINPATQNEK